MGKSNLYKSDDHDRQSNRPLSNVGIDKIIRQGSQFVCATLGNVSEQQNDLQPVAEQAEERNLMQSESNHEDSCVDADSDNQQESENENERFEREGDNGQENGVPEIDESIASQVSKSSLISSDDDNEDKYDEYLDRVQSLHINASQNMKSITNNNRTSIRMTIEQAMIVKRTISMIWGPSLFDGTKVKRKFLKTELAEVVELSVARLRQGIACNYYGYTFNR